MANSTTYAVNLKFNADTQQAKANILSLLNLLGQIATVHINADDSKLRAASLAASDLQAHLIRATNVDTGHLDLSKLDRSLKQSGLSLSLLSAELVSVGPTGQLSFIKLALAIGQSERAVFSLGTKVKDLGKTLMNTVKWQISSSAIHGFMGAIQTAVGYAENLNKSLNNIRIVTNYNIDYMDKFAEKANKAAKALSATTLDYTKGALIYFQLGLTDEEVLARTDVTIKMANAVGESTETVSNQLTAVWNNFYDGSKSLEYYADVMTALGAATASSTDEIAEGLEKFAAIAETVGLSYEYASSALATVTATTRQSAEVVGTAFKTLFARIQDLEVGETLDDGTTLGMYSQALASVGVNIKTTNGEMKSMDTILDELGGKWKSLSKDTQVALAQTVAGTRQYTQLVALMENWDYFQENVSVAEGSSGTLQNLADTYAEGWAAAKKEVLASLESIYLALLDDKFFISINKGFAEMLTGVNNFIKNLGGVKPVLIGISSLILGTISNKITPALNSLWHNVLVVFTTTEKQAANMTKEFEASVATAKQAWGRSLTHTEEALIESSMALAHAKEKYFAIENRLTDAEKHLYQYQILAIEALGKIQTEKAKNLEIAEKELKVAQEAYKVAKKTAEANKEKSGLSALSTLLNNASSKLDKDIERTRTNWYKSGADSEDSTYQKLLIMQGLKRNIDSFNQRTLGDFAKAFELLPGGVENTGGTGMATFARSYKSAWKNSADDILNSIQNDNLFSLDKSRNAALNYLEELKNSNTYKELSPGQKGSITKLFNAAGLAENLEQYEAALEKIKTKLELVGISADDIELRLLLTDLTPELLQTYSIEILSIVNSFPKLTNMSNELKEALAEMSSANTGEEMVQSLDKFKKAIASTSVTAKDLKAIIQKLPENSPYRTEAEAALKLKEAEEKAKGAVEEHAKAQKNLNNSIKAFKPQHVASGLETITSLAGSLGSVAMVVLSLYSSIKSLGDESASAGLKVMSFFTGITMTIVTLLPSFTRLKSSILSSFTYTGALNVLNAKGIAVEYSARKELNEEELRGLLIQKKGLDQEGAAQVARAAKLGSLAKEYLTKQKKNELDAIGFLLSELMISLDEKEAILANLNAGMSLKEAIAEAIVNKVKSKNIATNLALSISQKLVNAGMKEGLALALGSLAPILAVVAAIGAVVAIIKIWDANTVSAAEHLENLKLNVTDMKDAASEAADSVDKLKDAWSGWEEAEATLDSCVVGTTEWAEALKGARGAIDKLLEAYPSLKAMSDLFVWDDKTLSYVLNAEKVEKVIEDAEQASESAAYGSDMALIREEKDGLYNELIDYLELNTGRAVLSEDQAIELFNSLTDNADVNEEFIKSYLKKDDPLAVISDYNVEYVADQIAKYKSDKAVTNAALKYVSTQEGMEGASEYEILAAALGVANKEADIYLKLYGRNGTDGQMADAFSQSDTGYEYLTEDGKKILDRYAKAVGHEIEWDDNAVRGTDAERKFYIKGQDEGITAMQMATTIAASEALADDKNYTDAMAVVNGAISAAGGDSTALGAIGAIVHGGDSTAISNWLSTLTTELLEGLDTGSLALDEKLLGLYGLNEDSFKALVAEQVTQLNGQLDGLNFGNMQTENATAGLKLSFNNARKALTESDAIKKAGIDSLEVGYLNNIEELNKDNLSGVTSFYQALSKIDFSSENASDEILKLAEQYNILGGSVASLVLRVGELDHVYNISTANINAQREKLSKILGDDGLKIGDIVKLDDIDTLKEAGIDVDRFFTKTADGTYQLTKEAEAFNQAVNNITSTDLFAIRDKFAKARELSSNGYTFDQLQDTSVTDDVDLSKARMDFIKSFAPGTFNFTDEQSQFLSDYTNGTVTNELLQSSTELISGMMSIVNATEASLDSMIFSQAKTLEELQNTAIKMGEYSGNAYSDALMNLASKYENCGAAMLDYEAALRSGQEAQVEEAEAALKSEMMIGEAAAEYGLEAKDVSTQARVLKTEYNMTAEAAANLAVQNLRMNKGVATLSENWADWIKILKTSDKTTADYAAAVNDLNEVIIELVGASKDLRLPEEFFESADNLALIELAAQGSEDAINQLGLAVAAAQVERLQFNDSITDKNGKGIDSTAFNNWKNNILNGITELQNSLDGVGFNEDVYEILGGEDWVNALNEIAIATEMSTEQMNSMLNSMGVLAELTTTTKKTQIRVPTYTVKETPTGNEGEFKREIVSQELKSIEGEIEVAQINTGEKNKGKIPTINYVGNGSVSKSSTKSSGGGSSSKKADNVKKTDVVDRYKEVTDSLNDVKDAMDDVSRVSDRLYGKSRINAIKLQNELLQKEVKLLKDKKKEAEDYLKADRNELDRAASEAGVTLTYDGNNISNYTEVMTALWEDLNATIDRANADGNVTDAEQKLIDDKQKRLDNFKDAITQYDDTVQTLEDVDNELGEALDEIQDNNFTILTEELNLELEKTEEHLEIIDYYLDKLDDDFYSMAESAALSLSKLEPLTENLKAYDTNLQGLTEAFDKGEISLADYVEGLKKVEEGQLDTLKSLQELDKKMLKYYGTTLDKAGEELEFYTSRMEHATTVLEHYLTLLELVGLSKNYKEIGNLLKGQEEAAKNRANVAKSDWERLQKEADEQKRLRDEAIAAGNEEAAAVYEQLWRVAIEKAEEAEGEYLTRLENWAEAVKATLENQLKEFNRTLESTLTGGTSFDLLSTKMERAVNLQGEYLTTTNKIYETNKLMRTAQQEIDKSTNSAAKKRLQAYVNETKELLSKGRLSSYELKIQLAKYDLLLAQINLEETQNAKSNVRLKRDSEGNFGYVYTADSAAVAEAEQKLADAQNSLYNIGLEGAANYANKYLQTLSEMYNTLADLQKQYLEGGFESEEAYHKAVEEAKLYYYKMLEDYSGLYTIAIGTDNHVREDSWTTSFTDMIYSTDEWKNAVEENTKQVNGAFSQYNELLTSIRNELDTVKTNTDDLIKENKDLTDSITGKDGIIEGLLNETAEVKKVTEAWAAQRQEIMKTIAATEELIKTVGDLIDKLREAANSNNTNLTNSKDTSYIGQGNNTGATPYTPSSGSGTGSGGGSTGSISSKTSDEMKKIKAYLRVIGTTLDGIWGNQSKAAAKNWAQGKTMVVGLPGDGSLEWFEEAYETWLSFQKQKSVPTSVFSPKGGGGGVGRFAVTNAIAAFDTGGYTSSWGDSSGKLALLHQKELVLNAHDTENFLKSMEFLNNIVSTIDLYSASALLAAGLASPYYSGEMRADALELHVDILANFPNVTDRYEIEDAFNNLVNLASLYANRK